jgi:transcriptional regulator with XRE-family HTH domain
VDTQNTQKKRRMEALGAQLSTLRKEQGMPTQDDLAKKSRVGVRTISDIETGKKIPRVGTMRKIETALRLVAGATDDFMDGVIDVLVPQPAAVEDYPPEVFEREPRGEVEHEMLAIRGETDDVKWSYIIDRRKRLYDEKHTKRRQG